MIPNGLSVPHRQSRLSMQPPSRSASRDNSMQQETLPYATMSSYQTRKAPIPAVIPRNVSSHSNYSHTSASSFVQDGEIRNLPGYVRDHSKEHGCLGMKPLRKSSREANKRSARSKGLPKLSTSSQASHTGGAIPPIPNINPPAPPAPSGKRLPSVVRPTPPKVPVNLPSEAKPTPPKAPVMLSTQARPLQPCLHMSTAELLQLHRKT